MCANVQRLVHIFLFLLLCCFNIVIEEKESLTIQRCFCHILKFSYLKIFITATAKGMRTIGIAHFDFSFLNVFHSLYMATKCLTKLRHEKKGQTLANEWNVTYIEDKKDLSMALIVSYHWCMWPR